ncbi:integrase [Sinorhizobium meliloti]|nr:integrase [Sinorhizobium meliloti]
MAELSPFRRRMIEDVTVRDLSPATQRSYINSVQKFSRYFGRSPDRLDLEDVHAFQVHLVSTGIILGIAEPDRLRKMKKTGLFLPLRNLSESARIAEPEAGIGTAGILWPIKPTISAIRSVRRM